MDSILVWLLDKVAVRDELKTYLGHGDYASERGWWLFGRWWISYDHKRILWEVQSSDQN